MRLTDADHGINDADTIDESLFVLVDGYDDEWHWAIEREYAVSLANGEPTWDLEVIAESPCFYATYDEAERAAEQRKDEIVREMLKKSR